MRRQWWLGVGCFVVVLAACAGDDAPSDEEPVETPAEQTFDVDGSVVIAPGHYRRFGCDGHGNCDPHPRLEGMDRCAGSRDGFPDIDEGTRVTVTDQDGSVVDVATLEIGAAREGTSNFEEPCRMAWEAEVPEASFYTFSISERGEVTLSRDELEDDDWRVELTLGG